MKLRQMKQRLAMWIILLLLLAAFSAPLVAQPHTLTITAVAYSPDGSLIATASSDSIVKVWDASTGQNGQTLQGHTREIFDVGWGPDGSKLASAGADGRLLIWDTSTWQNTLTIVDDEANTAFFDLDWKPDGTEIAVSDSRNSVNIYDVSSGSLVDRLITHAKPVSAVAWSPDGNYILSGGWDTQLILWDANTGQLMNSIIATDSLTNESIDWHPNGLVAAVGNGDGFVRIWDPFSANVIAQIDAHSSHILGVLVVDWSANGAYLASGGGDGTIRIWNGADYSLLVTISTDEAVFGLSFHPTDDVVAYYSDTGTGSPIQSIPVLPLDTCNLTIPASDTTALIAAITSANGARTPQTLCLTSSTYTLNAASVITGDITIVGNGATVILVVGSGFEVAADGTLRLEHVTVIRDDDSGG